MSLPKSLIRKQISPSVDGTGLRALGEALDAVLAAEAGHGFARAADRLKALAGQAGSARKAIDPTGALAGPFLGARALPQ